VKWDRKERWKKIVMNDEAYIIKGIECFLIFR
jgi:hypothetical protein